MHVRNCFNGKFKILPVILKLIVDLSEVKLMNMTL